MFITAARPLISPTVHLHRFRDLRDPLFDGTEFFNALCYFLVCLAVQHFRFLRQDFKLFLEYAFYLFVH